MVDDDRKLVESALRAIASAKGLGGPAEAMDLVARRVESVGAAQLWHGFIRGSGAGDHGELVRTLTRIVAEEPRVREALRSLAATEEPDTQSPPRVDVRTGSQNLTLGENARIGRVSNTHKVKTVIRNITKRPGGAAALVLVCVVVVLVGVLLLAPLLRGGSGEEPTISEDLTCREYLQETAENRDRIVKSVGMDLGISDAGHPWAVNSMDYYCGQAPDSRFEQVMSQGWGL